MLNMKLILIKGGAGEWSNSHCSSLSLQSGFLVGGQLMRGAEKNKLDFFTMPPLGKNLKFETIISAKMQFFLYSFHVLFDTCGNQFFMVEEISKRTWGKKVDKYSGSIAR